MITGVFRSRKFMCSESVFFILVRKERRWHTERNDNKSLRHTCDYKWRSSAMKDCESCVSQSFPRTERAKKERKRVLLLLSINSKHHNSCVTYIRV